MINSSSCDTLLFSGTSHPGLAQEVAEHLGMELSPVQIENFPDGEISIEIQESVRGKDACVFQSVALKPNEYLMELLVMIDALKRASARSIVVVIPYFGYSRQDRKDKPRAPITAKLVANLLETAGATRVLTMDLHADQIQGFFDIPVDNLYARPCMVEAIANLGIQDLVFVAPDSGSVKQARAYAKCFGADFAFVDKRRVSSRDVEVTHVIGEVKGKTILLVDDICSTAGTIVKAAEACMMDGAVGAYAAITHSLMVESAVEKLNQSPIRTMFVSNSIPQRDEILQTDCVEVVSVARLFAEAIRCVMDAKSISSLFAQTSAMERTATSCGVS